MDLNSLYFRHQLLGMRARAAPSETARRAHQSSAAEIARSILALLRGLGANAALSWQIAEAAR